MSEKVFDPELTNKGVEKCRRIRPKFIQMVKNIFKNNPYIIGASWLLRTHLTAYHMFVEDTEYRNKKINIMPHIGEKGFDSGNLARSKEYYKSLEDIKTDKLGICASFHPEFADTKKVHSC